MIEIGGLFFLSLFLLLLFIFFFWWESLLIEKGSLCVVLAVLKLDI